MLEGAIEVCMTFLNVDDASHPDVGTMMRKCCWLELCVLAGSKHGGSCLKTSGKNVDWRVCYLGLV
jgi:hypothetical protein